MADSKISNLTNSLTKATVATNDLLPIVDTSATETKKMTYQELMQPIDTNFRIAGSSDNTKLVAFEVDGLTTATTRTITVPDSDLTMVGVATTQTLTNKTLTSPQINMGTNANGDIYYRDGSGTFTRLPIGSDSQILAVTSGLPAWIANPSASDASYTTKGIVKFLTDAATSGITITSGVANVNTGTAANNIVKLDASAKLPAVDGSQLTNLVTPASTWNYIPNTLETNNTWYSWTVPFLSYTAAGPTETLIGLTNTFTVGTGSKGGFGHKELSASVSVNLYDLLLGNGSNTSYTAASSKDIKFKWRMTQNVSGSGDYLGFGIVNATATLDDIQTSTAAGIRFVNNNGVLYASTADGTNNTNTNVDTGITDANWNTYEIVFNPGTDVKYYINGTLVATHSTNLPTGSLQYFGLGYTKTTNNITFYVAPITFSLEI